VRVPDPSPAAVAQNEAFARCVGVDPSLVDTATPPGEVRRMFVQGNIHIVNTVHLFPTPADATPRFDAYTRPAAASCLATLLKTTMQSEVARNVDIGAVSATHLPVPVHADHSVAYRLTAPVNTPQAQVNNYVDLVAVLQGRTAVLLETSTTGQPYNTTAEAALITKVLSRLP
jgi:hypothetical protein